MHQAANILFMAPLDIQVATYGYMCGTSTNNIMREIPDRLIFHNLTSHEFLE